MMDKYVKICPKCGSTNVKADLSQQSFGAGAEFSQYKCADCGYFSMIFPEAEKSKVKEFKKDIKKKK
jgi:transposase-like protein